MSKKWIFIASIVGLIVIGASLVGPVMSDVEKPDFEIISSDKNIEIRRYAPVIIAEVAVQGPREEAISDGFRLLADFIFGNNTATEKIAMTAPVSQQTSQKIAMTAPVQQQLSGDSWKVSFVMPSEYTMKTLPKPNNNRVILREIPQKEYIVLRYSGRISNDNIAKHERELMDYIKSHQIETMGSPIYAFYNPPWTLPFLRRNEIMVALN